jgi:CheY-like chemotaxis protein
MSRTVLIVEDQAPCAATLELAVSGIADVATRLATAAEDAWAILTDSREDIQALITDIELPGIDGLELVARVRSLERLARLPIIVISGSTDRDVADKAIRSGANSFLPKPYSPAQLRAKLEQLLNYVSEHPS